MVKHFLIKYSDAGILFMRIGIGMAYVFIYGLMKIEAGPEMWVMIGATMSKVGINFAPLFWGFMAAASEFFGGILILLGLFTRTAAAFMAFTMFMAFMTHLSALDPWYIAIHPMELFSVLMGLLFIGAGKYSLDNLFFGRKSNKN